MAKKITVEQIEETVLGPVCLACGGTGRGAPNGVYETTCKTCKGTGK